MGVVRGVVRRVGGKGEEVDLENCGVRYWRVWRRMLVYVGSAYVQKHVIIMGATVVGYQL